MRGLHLAIELLFGSGGADVDRHRARARLLALQRLRRDLEAAAESAVGDAAAAAAALTREAVDRWLDPEGRLREHRGVLHGPLRSLPDDDRLRAAYAGPAPETADGRAVCRAPRRAPPSPSAARRSSCSTGTASAPSSRPRWATSSAGAAGASDSGLRLYDDRGRGQALAGYGGEGPRGTLYVLRLCGFSEGREDDRGQAALERTDFGSRA